MMINADFLLLDIRSIAVLLFFGNLLSSILGSRYLALLRKDPANGRFLISKGLQTAAWALLMLRGYIPDALSILVANPLLFFSLCLESSAFLVLKGLYAKRVRLFYIVFLSFFTFIFMLIAAFDVKANLRISYVSLSSIGIYILPAVLLYRESDRTLLQKSICHLYFFACFVMVLRAYVSYSNTDYEFLRSNFIQSLSYLTFYVIMILGTFGYILLAKEKVDRELIKAATLDSLTGMYNRRAFFELAQMALSLAERKKQPLSLLMADLDHFKEINDMYGHDRGDSALKEFAGVLRSQLRSYDVCARFGGEEFLILLPNTDRDDSLRIAERIRRATESCSIPENPSIRLSVSIGVKYRGPEEGINLEQLIKRSDEALYTAKTEGRNRVIAKD